MVNDDQAKIDPKVKEVLDLLVRGALLSSLFLFPGAAIGIKSIKDYYESIKRGKDFDNWQKFNQNRLRSMLKRLRQQKMISVVQRGDQTVVEITQKGRRKILTYQLEKMQITVPKTWDGKWRLIIYDISKFRRREQSAFRKMLKQLKFYKLQKSVYLTPYPCDDEINFLREYFGIGEEVLYIVAQKLELETVYRSYFGLD